QQQQHPHHHNQHMHHNQQMLAAHQQQMATQASAMSHHPSHMGSIMGSLNGNNGSATNSFSAVPISIGALRLSSLSHHGIGAHGHGHGPTTQSPTASRVLSPNGVGMSGRANALAAAGIRRLGIASMQQPSMHHHRPQHQHPHSGGSFAPPGSNSFQQQHMSSMQQMGSMGFMGGSGPVGRVSMDASSSSGPDTHSSASMFDVYGGGGSAFHQVHPHSHHFILPANGVTDSSGNASGETSTTATSLEPSSNGAEDSSGSGNGSRSGGGSADRPGSSSVEETMKEQKRRVDPSAPVLSKAAVAAQQQQQHLQAHHHQRLRRAASARLRASCC
ncbi:hypothetical protein OC844_007851, partial [Tilletia horrida]